MKKLISFSFLVTASLPNLAASEVLSYSGRLVNATGVPVSGSPTLKFDLVYSGDTSTIICSKTLAVPLANGVFHASLDFVSADCGGKTLVQVLSEIPASQTLAYQVTDQTNGKAYGFQTVAAVPTSVYSQMAKTIADHGANDGQVLKWNAATKKWLPSTVSAGSGSLTDLQAGPGISVASVDSDTYSVGITNGGVGTIQLADGAVTTAKIADGTITGVDLANTTIPYAKLNLADGSIPSAKVNGLDSALTGKEPAITSGTPSQYWRGDKSWQDLNAAVRAAITGVAPLTYNSSTGAIGLGTVPVSNGGTGLTTSTVNSIVTTSSSGAYQFLNCSPGEVVVFQITGPQCGTISTVDNTKLPLAGGTMTGVINMGGNRITNADDPSAAQDLATKNYVDTVAAAGPWAVNGSDVYRLVGNVGIGTSSPTSKLTVSGADEPLSVDSSNSSVNKIGLYDSGTIRGYIGAGATHSFIVSNSAGASQLSVDNLSGNVGIGTATPNGKLEVNGSIVMSGGASGFVGFQAPAVAGSNVWVLPGADGASGQVLSTNGVGVLSWVTPTSSGITSLTGDVTGTGPGATATTISNNAITSAKIADGTITDADVAANSISYSKLNLADGDIPSAKVNGLDTALVGKEPIITAGALGQYWRGDKSWQTLNTDVVAEATNLYFTPGRARLSFSGTAPINYNDTTGVIALDTVPIAKGGTGLTTSVANAVMTTDATGAYQNTTCADGEIIQFDSVLGVKCSTLPSGVDATKLPLAGGTMSGAIAMGSNKITGLGEPTALQDAATKNYVDSNSNNKLPLAGGTMTGEIAMGTSKITGVGNPTNPQDAATKNYVDTAIAGAGVASDTDGLPEGSTNLYFTETRARVSLSGTAPINYDDTTGVIALDTVTIAKGGTGRTTSSANAVMTTDATGAYQNTVCANDEIIQFDTILGVKCAPLPSGVDNTKLPLAGGTMTGAISMGTNAITNLADPTAAQDAATKNYVDSAIAGAGVASDTDGLPEGSTNLYYTNTRARASLSGTAPINYNDTTGVIALDTVTVAKGGTGLTTSSANAVMTTDATGAYQNTTCADGEIIQFDSVLGVKCSALPSGVDATKLPLAGGTMSGAIAMGSNAITGLADPTALQDAATKNYVDTAIAGAGVASDTDSLPEGSTNLYFTDTRARASLSGTAPINYDDSTGVIALDTVTVAKGGTGLTTSAANSVMTTDATGAYQNTVCANDEIIQFDTVLGVKCAALPSGVDNTKLPLAGGTMTGAIAMGTNKITDLGAPTADADAATKLYVDTAVGAINSNDKLPLAGGTMTGAILMGSNLISGLADPVGAQDAATKNYVDAALAGAGTPSTTDDLTEGSTNLYFTVARARASLSGTAPISYDDTTGVIALDTVTVAKGGTGLTTSSANSVMTTDATGAYQNTNCADGEFIQFDTLLGVKCGTLPAGSSDKLPLAGGTMTGAIAMGANAITGLADPTNAQDAATKNYVDAADATKLDLAGGSMTGVIAMGTNKITGVGEPTDAQDAATKNYVDTALAGAGTPSTTDDLTEGSTNLYFTGARARASLSGTAPINYDDSTGVIALDTVTVAKGGTGLTTSAANAVMTTDSSGAYQNTVCANDEIIQFDTILGVKCAALPSGVDNTKLPLAGGTMTGAIVMGSNKITDLGVPTADADAATKLYVDTTVGAINSDDKLPLAGGAMTGAIAMGANAITGLADPTNAQDAATKNYVDAALAGAGTPSTTDDLTEGSTNLYFTNARARASLSGTAPINYDDTTGVIALDTVTVAKGGTGLTTSAANSVMTTDATGAYQNTNCADGEFIQFDTLLGVKCGTLPAGSTDKLPLAGGTMTGAIAMGANAITGLADPTNAQDAATKNYVDAADATKLDLAGGTMTGAIAMGSNRITGVGEPTDAQDAATKNYVDTALAAAGSPSTTDDLTEGSTNFYFTDARARASLSGTAPINYDDSTGVIALDTVTVAKGGTGLTTSSANAVMTTDATGAYQNTACSNGEILQFDTILGVKCAALPAGSADKLPLAGGTMTGTILMGANKIGNLADPTLAQDAATKNYVDSVVSAGGAWTVAGGNVHRSTGRVGIGTATPTYPLDVVIPNGEFKAARFKGSSWSDSIIQVEAGTGPGRVGVSYHVPSTIDFMTFLDPSTSKFYWNPGSNMNSPSTNAMVMDIAAGRMGIGTASPNGKLDVKGSIVMSGSTSGFSGFRVPAAAGSTVWTLPSADGTTGQVLSTNGSGVLSWSTPSGGADNLGNHIATQTLQLGSNTINNNGGTNGLSFDTAGRATITTLSGSVSTGMTLQNTSPASGSGTAVAFKSGSVQSANIEAVVQGSTSDNDLIFSTRGSNTLAERMRITSSGSVNVNGPLVLKGSVSGTSGFQAAATAGSTIWTLPMADGTSGQVLSTNGAGVLSWTTASGGGGSGDFKADGTVPMTGSLQLNRFLVGGNSTNVIDSGTSPGGQFTMRTSDADIHLRAINNNNILFTTSANERMRINISGNVGINTTSPNGKLDVKGSIVMSGATSGYTGFQAPAAAGSTVWTLPSADGTSGQVLSTNGSGVLSWTTASGGGGSGDLKADGTVNMTGQLKGITGSSPGFTFVGDTDTGISSAFNNQVDIVSGGVSNASFYSSGIGFFGGSIEFTPGLVTTNKFRSDFSAASTQSNVAFGANNTAGLFFPASNTVAVSTSSTERLRFLSNGNVAVGKTTANGKLDVNGSVVMSGSVSGYSGFQAAATAGSTVWTLPMADGTSGQVLSTNGAGVLSWTTAAGGGSQWTTTSGNVYRTSGNVGIGTSTPSSALDILAPQDTQINLASSTGTKGTSINTPADHYMRMGGSGQYDVQMLVVGSGFASQPGRMVFRYGAGGSIWENTDGSSRTERMRITPAGDVGIGNATPTEKLEVSGNVKATAFISTSDKRLKKNIQVVKGLPAILQLRGVSYDWREDGSMDMGVIAQETEKVFPWAVVTDKVSGYKAVKYDSLVAPLIEAVKDLDKKDKEISRKIASIEEENVELKKKNKELETMILELAKRLDKLESGKKK